VTYAGPRYDKERWRSTVENGKIDRDLLREVEVWPTFDRDLGGPAIMHPEAAAAMGVMLRQAAEDGHGDLTISLSYRTFAKQLEKWSNFLGRDGVRGTSDDGNLAATPGTSNHGWAVSGDMGWGRGSSLAWLQANARGYGFVNDVPSENWHYTFQEGLWKGDDLTKDEKALLNWLGRFRDGVTGNLGGLDTGPSIGKRVADAVTHAGSAHPGGTIDLSKFASALHEHGEGRTGPPIKREEGGHVHGEGTTGPPKEPAQA